jgi:hypothetical protein
MNALDLTIVVGLSHLYSKSCVLLTSILVLCATHYSPLACCNSNFVSFDPFPLRHFVVMTSALNVE